jgi:hypothetical protein
MCEKQQAPPNRDEQALKKYNMAGSCVVESDTCGGISGGSSSGGSNLQPAPTGVVMPPWAMAPLPGGLFSAMLPPPMNPMMLRPPMPTVRQGMVSTALPHEDAQRLRAQQQMAVIAAAAAAAAATLQQQQQRRRRLGA